MLVMWAKLAVGTVWSLFPAHASPMLTLQPHGILPPFLAESFDGMFDYGMPVGDVVALSGFYQLLGSPIGLSYPRGPFCHNNLLCREVLRQLMGEDSVLYEIDLAKRLTSVWNFVA